MKYPVPKKAIAAVIGLTIATSLGLAGAARAGAFGGQERAESEQGEAQDEAKEAQMLSAARVSLADAARTAEQHTSLKASDAELDDEAAAPTWKISVGSGAQEKTVAVDAVSGQVKSVAADSGEDAQGDND